MPNIIPDLVHTKINCESETTPLNYFTNVLIILRKGVLYEHLFETENSSTFSIIVPNTTNKHKLLQVFKQYFTHINRIGICFASPIQTDDIPLFLEESPLFLKNECNPYSDNVQFMIDIIKLFNVNIIDFLAPNTLNHDNYLNYYNILSKETNVVLGASNNTQGIIYYGSNRLSHEEVVKIYFKQNNDYYKYLYRLPKLANIGRCGTGIVVDIQGNIYVNNSDDNTVSKIYPDGTSIILGITDRYPLGIAMDSRGNIYTANEQSNTVSKITPNGVSTMFAKTENNPAGIVIDANDNIYVTNSRSHNVSKITPDGISTIFASTGRNPVGIVIDPKGYLYTANNGGNNITKISPNGESSIFVDNVTSVTFIVLDLRGNLYVSRSECKTIHKITPDGISIPIQLQKYPMAIAIDSLDNVYINFYQTKQIYTIKSENILKECTMDNTHDFKGLHKNGNKVQLELFGSINGNPGGMIIDKLDNIYIANITHHLLHKDTISIDQ